MASIPYELYADNSLLWGVCNNKDETIIIDCLSRIFKKIKFENYIRELNPTSSPYHICINSYDDNRSYHFAMDEERIQPLIICNKLTMADENCMIISMYMFQKIQKLYLMDE